MPVTITDRNRIPDILQELLAVKRMRVDAGVFDHPEIAVRAVSNEFGLGNCPERSVFRASLVDQKQVLGDHVLGGVVAVIKGVATAAELGESVGMMMEAGIKSLIDQQIPPPLAPATVKRKGTDKTWIDTGETRSAVTYRVAKR